MVADATYNIVATPVRVGFPYRITPRTSVGPVLKVEPNYYLISADEGIVDRRADELEIRAGNVRRFESAATSWYAPKHTHIPGFRFHVRTSEKMHVMVNRTSGH